MRSGRTVAGPGRIHVSGRLNGDNLINLCTCTLKPYVKDSMYGPQLVRSLSKYLQSLYTRVELKLTTWLFLCGRFLVMVRLFALTVLQSTTKRFDTSKDPTLVRC